MEGQIRVLDIDLDFFLSDVAHNRAFYDPRLDSEDYTPWSEDSTVNFLRDQCLLSEKIPGFVVEHHDEIFLKIGKAIENGSISAPFELTHIDAHSDLGLGDCGYMHIMEELLFLPAEDRYSSILEQSERIQQIDFLNHSNWLAYTLACRWISKLECVFNKEDTDDLFPYYFLDEERKQVELASIEEKNSSNFFNDFRNNKHLLSHIEPAIPFSFCYWEEFQVEKPFDIVCLTRSPAFTPIESDNLFNIIQEKFIDKKIF